MPKPASSNCTAVFADRHIHGIAGVDFATSGTAAMRDALQLLAQRRTTNITASLPSLELGQLQAALQRLAVLHAADLITGVHLEGPFLAPAYAGAHPRRALVEPNSPAGTAVQEVLRNHQSSDRFITMMTIAPEVPGFESAVEELVALGVNPALGHTAATYQQMRHGIDRVYKLTGRAVTITHVHNAMREFHHRAPGPLLGVVEAVDAGRAVVELIADAQHVSLELVGWWFRHYPTAIRLVSDASAATLPPGVVTPLTDHPPRLGHQQLRYPDTAGPLLADGATLASGAKDLLAIHDDLLAAGFDHELVCPAMRATSW